MIVTQTFNEIYEPVFFTKARYIHLWGGRSRGGSHFATDYFLYLITQPQYFRGVFLRATFGDIKGSLFQDFKDRLEDSDFDEADFNINETLLSITHLPTGNKIISKGFKKSSGNQSAKLKSIAGITHVLVEETEEVDEDDFNKLDDSIRTNRVEHIQIICLFNPPSKNHWLIRRNYNLLPCGLFDDERNPLPWYKAKPKDDPNLLSIHSSYEDNIENINASTIQKFKDYGDKNSKSYNPDYYFRDVRGFISEGVKGRIYENWKYISEKEYSQLPYSVFYGLDFGFSADPVALVEIKNHNNTFWVKELIYSPGLTNFKLAEKMEKMGISKRSPIYADSAEPKSIRELQDLGFNIIHALKGPDSVNAGIKFIQGKQVFATEKSENIWFENQEYKWQLDQDKQPTPDPVDKNNHAKDAFRYAVYTRFYRDDEQYGYKRMN